MSVQPGLRGSNDLRVGWKMATFQLFFQSMEQLVVRRGQIRRIGWVIKTMEAQVGQFLPGCKCPVSRSIVVQEQDALGDLPVVFFLQNVLQLYQQRWVTLRVDSFTLRPPSVCDYVPELCIIITSPVPGETNYPFPVSLSYVEHPDNTSVLTVSGLWRHRRAGRDSRILATKSGVRFLIGTRDALLLFSETSRHSECKEELCTSLQQPEREACLLISF